MKQTTLITMVVVAVLTVSMLVVSAPAQDEKAPKSETMTVYTCPMHENVKASWAASCPDCDMALVGSEEEAAASTMHDCGFCPMSTSRGSAVVLKDELNLSEKQMKMLQTIAEKAQMESKAILTEGKASNAVRNS